MGASQSCQDGRVRPRGGQGGRGVLHRAIHERRRSCPRSPADGPCAPKCGCEGGVGGQNETIRPHSESAENSQHLEANSSVTLSLPEETAASVLQSHQVIFTAKWPIGKWPSSPAPPGKFGADNAPSPDQNSADEGRRSHFCAPTTCDQKNALSNSF